MSLNASVDNANEWKFSYEVNPLLQPSFSSIQQNGPGKVTTSLSLPRVLFKMTEKTIIVLVIGFMAIGIILGIALKEEFTEPCEISCPICRPQVIEKNITMIDCNTYQCRAQCQQEWIEAIKLGWPR